MAQGKIEKVSAGGTMTGRVSEAEESVDGGPMGLLRTACREVGRNSARETYCSNVHNDRRRMVRMTSMGTLSPRRPRARLGMRRLFQEEGNASQHGWMRHAC